MALNVLLALSGLAAVAGLVLTYGGFGLSNRQESFLRTLQFAVVVIFILDRLLRWMLAKRPLVYARENWPDFALIAALLAAVGIVAWQAPSARNIYVIIAQAYIVLALLLRAVNLNMRLAGSGIPSPWLLVGSFAAICLIGSGLLMLPVATPEARPISYADAAFTAVSATCVTGLVVRDTGTEFTLFGQVVIIAMIQLGGLGIMLFGTALATSLGKGLSMRSSAAMGEMLSVDTVGQVRRTVRFVIVTTFLLEAAGAVMFFGMFKEAQGPYVPTTAHAIWQSAFHSISSFCNAGFALYGQNVYHGVSEGWSTALRDHWQVMGVMAPLIILGGLGFPVLQDLGRYFTGQVRRLRRRFRPRIGDIYHQRAKVLSLQSKIVLTATGILLLGGMIGLLLLEPRLQTADDWQTMSTGRRIREAAFQSVTARTAGFNTIDMAELSDAGKLWMCGLMTVGGSPASTAGGMKTVTLAVLILSTIAALRHRDHVEVFRRRIAFAAFHRAVAVAVLYGALLATVTLLLAATMRPGYPLIDLLFEASSACGTVGLSTGVTGELTVVGKGVIVMGMFVGRLGPLTLLLAMAGRRRNLKYAYPTEDIVTG